MQTLTSTISKITTDRPAPILPGFIATQALSKDGIPPNITQYHRELESALRWLNRIAKKGIFDAFLMGRPSCHWFVFDRHGQKIETRKRITPEEGVFKDLHQPLQVSLLEYIESMQEILGESVYPMTFAVHHALASSVGHSNTQVITHSMIMNASDEDLDHVYFADGIVDGCRAQGWFMDTDAVSEELMDKYLDRYKWLSKGWPLDNKHHAQTLAYRMATFRPQQVVETLVGIGEHAQLGEHADLVGARIREAHTKVLSGFTAKMLEGLETAVLLVDSQEQEALDSEVLIQYADRIAALYRETFLQ